MNDLEHLKFSSFIEKEIGIKMPPSKKTMLESRLSKRLQALGYNKFMDYYNYLTSSEGYQKEFYFFANVISTNKTDFFREPKHWVYLENVILPEIIKINQIHKNLNIWSSACSTGEEPYTIAMVIDDYLKKHHLSHYDYNILASDISTDVLNKALRAVYQEAIISPIPTHFKHQYLMKSIHRHNPTFRITPELRSKVRFRRINLIEEDFKIKKEMDIIFCRNVLIYFERKNQEKIIQHLTKHLKKGGYLIIGHSESMIGFKVNLTSRAPTIYRKN